MSSPFILVDTSIWIDLLSKNPTKTVALERLPLLATCPPIVQEVLQGVRDEVNHQKIHRGLLSLHLVFDLVPLNVYLEASEIYRAGRRRGYTIRSSADCLIAAIARAGQVAVWHQDRDFQTIAKFVDIKLIDF